VSKVIDQTFQEESREIVQLRYAVARAAALLKRAPTVTRNIYVGRDKVSWGAQAAEMAEMLSKTLEAER
jgi:hypothetical protein